MNLYIKFIWLKECWWKDRCDSVIHAVIYIVSKFSPTFVTKDCVLICKFGRPITGLKYAVAVPHRWPLKTFDCMCEYPLKEEFIFVLTLTQNEIKVVSIGIIYMCCPLSCLFAYFEKKNNLVLTWKFYHIGNG